MNDDKPESMKESSCQELFNAISDGLAFIDSSDKLEYCNIALAEFLEFDEPSELIGRKLTEFFSSDKATELSIFDRLRDGEKLRYEFIVKTGKGNKKYALIALTPRYDNQGKYIGCFGDITDITELKIIEKASRESEAKYKTLVDNIGVGVAVIDKEMNLLSVNKFLYDAIPNLEVKKNCKCHKTFIQPPRDSICVNCPAIKVFEDGKTHQSIVETPTSADVKSIRLVATPLRNTAGEIYAVIETVEDITEIQRGREQLIQSEKLAALGTLSAGVAHEINNPMAYINSNLITMQKYIKKIDSYIERISSNRDDAYEKIKYILEDFQDAVDESLEGSGRVRKIVADLKSFTRLDRVKTEYADINEGIKSTLNIVWNELKYKCKVETEYGDIPMLFCNANQLNQVFLNILMNAAQAIERNDGLIMIRTWCNSKAIHVSFKDNGSGMTEEVAARIFEPFFTTKEVGRGTGLGMSLSFDIINKHRGIIEVSTKPNEGTEFEIVLPLDGLKQSNEQSEAGDRSDSEINVREAAN